MTVTKSIINDGEIVDYTKSHVPYMDSRFLCSLTSDEEPAIEQKKTTPQKKAKVAAEPAPTLWIEPKPAESRLVFKANDAMQQTLKIESYSAAPQPVYSVTVTAKPAEEEVKACDPCTNDPNCSKHAKNNDVALAIRESLLSRKAVLDSLDEKTAEIRATIKTIDWVLSLFSDYP